MAYCFTREFRIDCVFVVLSAVVSAPSVVTLYGWVVSCNSGDSVFTVNGGPHYDLGLGVRLPDAILPNASSTCHARQAE